MRAAPKVTIDFGDGRTLVRTITGNSLHYILDAEGRPLDVLPGLWGPGDFLRRVREARESPLRSLSPSSSSLDANSRLLMRAKAPPMDEAAFERIVAAFERTIAQDTRRNAEMRRLILPWLDSTPSLPGLTERIYRDAFLTPRSDPWLGLVTADTYAAIEGDPAPAAGGSDALKAGALAASKMLIEGPILAKVAPATR